MVELFIVAGARIYREALAQALKQAGNLHVAATAAGLTQLGDGIAMPARAVLLIDGTCPGSAASLRAVLAAHPNVRAVVLGVTESEPEIIGWAEAGASGYVTREGSIDELVKAVEAVARDELTCPPRITAALMHRVAALATEQPLIIPPPARLSDRELEIVRLIDDGMSNQEIAHQLFITLATVKNHVHNILDKLGVHTRTEAAALVRRPPESAGRQPWPDHTRCAGTATLAPGSCSVLMWNSNIKEPRAQRSDVSARRSAGVEQQDAEHDHDRGRDPPAAERLAEYHRPDDRTEDHAGLAQRGDRRQRAAGLRP
jgi:DNA-binding NarL/FixJ family response regulator